MLPIDSVREYERNPRQNGAAVGPVARSIQEFGFKVPIIVDRDNVLIAGHTRIKAARQLGLADSDCGQQAARIVGVGYRPAGRRTGRIESASGRPGFARVQR
ncbi:MAG: ParB N-terminal domain-containing protein [Phycisphaerae bacterium]|nr:ParB N-terminal domain-containing protein [Phycisphaerae bacterium]